MTTSSLARVPFVHQILVPFRRYASPSGVFTAVVPTRAGSEPTFGSVKAKAEISPAAQRGRYFFFCSSVPNSLRGWGTPIDWWAESNAETLPSTLPRSRMTLAYSTFVNPSPPYFLGIFIPKAPSRRSPSSTSGGYSPVASMRIESTSFLRKASNFP